MSTANKTIIIHSQLFASIPIIFLFAYNYISLDIYIDCVRMYKPVGNSVQSDKLKKIAEYGDINIYHIFIRM